MAENVSAARPEAAAYFFHLDARPERIRFSSRLELTGWLFHRQGAPIHGLRAVVRSRLRRDRIFLARRKRARPAIGAAYPDLPAAAMSGFLIEVEPLPFGTSTLKLEVKDESKKWRCIFQTRLTTYSFDQLKRARFTHVHRELVSRLKGRVHARAPELAIEDGELEEIRARFAGATAASAPGPIRTVHLFVTSKSNLFIVEIAQLICAGFREAGFTAELFVDRIPDEETPNETIQLVVTPHEFYNLFFSPQFPEEEIRRRTRQLYLLGTEQPESDWFHSNLVIAPYARAMLDINPLGVAGYRARGLRCYHLPLGYHPLLNTTGIVPTIEREIDISLLASLTERREKFLAVHADFFTTRNCHLRLVPIGFAKTETTKSYLPIGERNALLQNSKILLNIHYSELRYFEWHRMLVGLANGCCIVTETCEGYAPLIPGKHFVMVEPTEVIRACDYYLTHAEERARIAKAGRDFIRQHLTQATNCAGCVEQIATGRYFSLGSGAAESDPAPEALPEALRQSHRRDGSLVHAFTRDLRAWFTSADDSALTIPSATADENAIAFVREKRRGFVERFAQQEAARARAEEPWTITENETFRAASSPSLSVLITLYNYEHYIEQCIGSLAEAFRSEIPGGIEVLVVDDASTDRSLERAALIQQRSPLPIRIVAKKFNTGLADARNVGLEMARAPYVFILDADNLIFPRALELLYEAITNTGAAAAYSILTRFQGRPEDRTGLLSYYDWDPRTLVGHPYIDAMALFDRAQLIALGGYDNELFKVGWFGWEDYELWLRMAAAHLNATLVPNILCLYRHHESAMSRTTNLFEIDLVRHLIGRYQTLIDEYQPEKQIFGVEWSRLT
jgi:GT2 family glycosyltransferase